MTLFLLPYRCQDCQKRFYRWVPLKVAPLAVGAAPENEGEKDTALRRH